MLTINVYEYLTGSKVFKEPDPDTTNIRSAADPFHFEFDAAPYPRILLMVKRIRTKIEKIVLYCNMLFYDFWLVFDRSDPGSGRLT